jgi:hypothetical protein
VGVRGKPEIRIRSEPFDLQLQSTGLPKEVGKIADISPIDREGRSIWLVLAEDGLITHFNANTAEWRLLARVSFVSEPDHKPWRGQVLNGNYIRLWVVISLQSSMTMAATIRSLASGLAW